MSLNHVAIMGRLTKDPDLRSTQNGTSVASFTLAVDRDYSQDKQTDFLNCTAWRQSAEFVGKYFRKGSMAVVTGRIQVRQYNDKNGDKRTATEVVADHIYFGESKAGREEAEYAASEKGTYTPAAKPAMVEVDEDGELPF